MVKEISLQIYELRTITLRNGTTYNLKDHKLEDILAKTEKDGEKAFAFAYYSMDNEHPGLDLNEKEFYELGASRELLKKLF